MTDKKSTIPDDEIVSRAAHFLSDTLESRRISSGLPLKPAAAELHERAVHRLEVQLRRNEKFGHDIVAPMVRLYRGD